MRIDFGVGFLCGYLFCLWQRMRIEKRERKR